MKCFERLVMRQIKDLLPPSLDPMQFAFSSKLLTYDAISTTLHLSLTHLENKDTFVRMLFIDFSSAFNTIIPLAPDQEAEPAGHHHVPMQLDPGLPDWETSVSPDREQHLQHHHTEHWSSSGAH
ncbi:hypothetical protein QTP86_011213 [Hemibagrus guttatus]|nr:hypothetical protein QTP86_011213 [Hemibagrus guttatus]